MQTFNLKVQVLRNGHPNGSEAPTWDEVMQQLLADQKVAEEWLEAHK